MVAKADSSPGMMKFCWEARPWLTALREDRALPASVLGPVESCAFAALAAARAVVVMGVLGAEGRSRDESSMAAWGCRGLGLVRC